MGKQLTKEQLQKQLESIRKKEEKEFIERHYPEFKKLEGKCFKSRNNYSCPEKPSDYWWIYVKVTRIKSSDVYDTMGNGASCRFTGWSFQTDKYGNISIEPEYKSYAHLLGKEITEKEFNAAWDKMIGNINNLQ